MNRLDTIRLDRVFVEKAAADPDARALVVDDEAWTRGEILTMARRATAALTAAGVRPGDRVLAQYTTDAADLAVAVAVSGLGCTFIPVPTSLGALELSHIIGLAGPSLCLAKGASLPKGTQVPQGTALLTSDEAVSGAAEADIACEPIPLDHTAVIGVTSGSTGLPKGVMHTWDAVHYAAAHAAAVVRIRDGESICTPGASAGAPGFTFFTYLGLSHGATIVRASAWNPDRVLDLMARNKCVWSMTVVTMIHMFIDAARKRSDRPDLSHMRGMCVGGSAIKPELIREAREVLGVEALRMFGLSEAMGFATMSPQDPVELRDELDGFPYAGTEIVALDEDRSPLPHGEVGEAGVRGPSVMQGYLGDTEPESRFAPGGYFLTGDWVRIDDSGFIKVVGRKKDLIIRGGYNIDPVEIETLVRRRDDVVDAAVFGLPDDRLGEIVAVAVVPQPGHVLTLDDITTRLRAEGLSPQKAPQALALLDEFPLSPDGKVLKEKLKASMQTERVGVSR
jgi:acyl-CoA synthetase (AMP-forming)/AMP-acid ligase II